MGVNEAFVLFLVLASHGVMCGVLKHRTQQPALELVGTGLLEATPGYGLDQTTEQFEPETPEPNLVGFNPWEPGQPHVAEGHHKSESSLGLEAGEAVLPSDPWVSAPDSTQASIDYNPEMPHEPVPPQPAGLSLPGKSGQRNQVPINSVAVQCGEALIRVEVQQDFLGTGQLIDPEDLTLGGCAVTTFDPAARKMLFVTELKECNSVLMMLEDVLIYSFTLVYTPTPFKGTPIVKTNDAEVTVQCHYLRNYNVSSNSLNPTWVPYISTKVAEQKLFFSLQLMMEDWQAVRPPVPYVLGEVMNIEATVFKYHHTPLMIFMDSCVATLDPDMNSQPSYSFIKNHGCLTDARDTGSQSHFLTRTHPNKLRLELETFRFRLDDRSSIYITCRLKARSAHIPIDSQHKTCSFAGNAVGWGTKGRQHEACDCCDTTCDVQRKTRGWTSDSGPVWEGLAAMGPIVVLDSQRMDIQNNRG